jgi:diadenosine tetraphosphatase ApaH/serine/threonine PP2A family protein phosphatase
VRYALVSDIHANLEALLAVFARIAENDNVLCLGDIVGYGPDPNGCVALVRARAAQTVLGNHDVAAIDDQGLEYFNGDARAAIEWTQTVLAVEHAAWLDGLAYEARLADVLLVHGAPVDYFKYVLDKATAAEAFADTDAPLVFVGHSHIAEYYALAPDGSIGHEHRQHGGELVLEAGTRYIVNPGSVGQPRDLNPDASFAFYDEATRRIAWQRVPYAIGAVQEKIGAAHLPASCARRLAVGR